MWQIGPIATSRRSFPVKSDRIWSLIFASCSLVLLVALFTAVAQEPGTAANPSDPSGTGQASASDKQFVSEALTGGMAEVQLGQLASQKSSSDDVKQFGQKMVEDHTRLGDRMKGVASQIGVTPPDSISPKDQALMARLHGLSREQFDRVYIRAMVRDHEKDLQAFKAEAASTSSPAVREAATQGEQIVSHHLDMIRQIAQSHNVTARATADAAEKPGR
jgi:putative membrane protein